MSESDKKTPIVPKELESEWLQFLKQKEEDREDLEMEAYCNTLVGNMQRNNPVRVNIGPPPNLDKNPNYGFFAARMMKTGDILPAVSVLRAIGTHVSEIRLAIADNRDGNSTNTIVEGKVEALAKYLGGLPPIEVAAHPIQDSDKKDKCATPPLPPSEKDNFAEIEVSLRNQRSWFLKQNEELLKLLDCLHKQEYDEGVQEEEILDRISDFTLVLFEYVKTLKKRKGSGAVCV